MRRTFEPDCWIEPADGAPPPSPPAGSLEQPETMTGHGNAHPVARAGYTGQRVRFPLTGASPPLAGRAAR